jgi:mRNA interferase MazF
VRRQEAGGRRLEIICPSLPKRSWIKITQIRTISNDRIGNYIDRINTRQINEIVSAINDSIGED